MTLRSKLTTTATTLALGATIMCTNVHFTTATAEEPHPVEYANIAFVDTLSHLYPSPAGYPQLDEYGNNNREYGVTIGSCVFDTTGRHYSDFCQGKRNDINLRLTRRDHNAIIAYVRTQLGQP